MAVTTEEQPYQSLYRRYRPQRFSEVKGQDHVVQALRNAVRTGRVAHAYLFSGPRGTGKTSTARILAKALSCSALDDGEPCGSCPSCEEISTGRSFNVHELDAASNNGVDAMRELISHVAFGTPGRYEVYIIDEVHMLSVAASNALLKTLEEPPSHVVFVLATTEPTKVLPTVRSRTQSYEFHLLSEDTVADLLQEVSSAEGLQLSPEALSLATSRAHGSARDALCLLDQVVLSGAEADPYDEVVLGIVEAISQQDASSALIGLERGRRRGDDMRTLATMLTERLRQGYLLLLAPELVEVSGAGRDTLAMQAGRIGLAGLVRAVEVLGEATSRMHEAADPYTCLETAIARLTHPELDTSLEALAERMSRLEQVVQTVKLSLNEPRSSAQSSTVSPSRPSRDSASSSSRIAGVDRQPVESAVLEDSSLELSHQDGLSQDKTAEPQDEAAEPRVFEPRAALGAFKRSPRKKRSSELTSSNEPEGQPEDHHISPLDVGDVAHSQYLTRDQLVKVWGDQVLPALHPSLRRWYGMGRFIGVEDDNAGIFAVVDPFYQLKCDRAKQEVEAELSKYLKKRITLKVVVDDGRVFKMLKGAGSPEADVEAYSYDSFERLSSDYEGLPPEGLNDHDGESIEEIQEFLDGDHLKSVSDTDVTDPGDPTIMVGLEDHIQRVFPGAEEIKS